jgi:beta-lactam-binding protein with PASTA domain
MPDKTAGPSTSTIVLIAVLATPVVLVVIFWLVGTGSADATSNLPDLQGKGLQWATAQAKDAGFDKVETHDSLGRNRHWRDDKEWMVCFEVPRPGAQPAKGTTVQLGVVKTDEVCPNADQGRFEPAKAQMPDLVNRTAYMTVKILGDNASIRFLNRANGDEVSRSLGDWRVCAQSPKPGERFDGLPVTTLVIPYEKRC